METRKECLWCFSTSHRKRVHDTACKTDLGVSQLPWELHLRYQNPRGDVLQSFDRVACHMGIEKKILFRYAFPTGQQLLGRVNDKNF